MEIVIVVAAIVGGYVLIRRVRSFRRRDELELDSRQTERFKDVDLEDVFASSVEHPRLVFLDDPYCPVSAFARRQVTQADVDVVTIDVSRQQNLAHELEHRTGIQHESPQIMLIDKGIAVWHQSHWRITNKSIHHALDQISSNGQIAHP